MHVGLRSEEEDEENRLHTLHVTPNLERLSFTSHVIASRPSGDRPDSSLALELQSEKNSRSRITTLVER